MSQKVELIQTNLKPAMEADATSGKKNLCRNFIYNEITFKYAS